MSLRVSGNNYSNYQNMYQMMQTLQASRAAGASKLNQAVTPISRVPRVKSSSVNYTDTLKFVQNYGKTMADVKLSASKLQSGNSSNVFSGFSIQSGDESVAKIGKTYRPRESTDINLQVQSLAQAQQNRSQSLNGAEAAAEGSAMSFEITSSQGKNVRINVSDRTDEGAQKTNEQMMREAAQQINSRRGLGVTASVANEDGKVSLVLTSERTGESSGFTVQGEMGAAAGAETTTVQGQNAQYTVTQDGRTTNRVSETNQISLDYGRVDATLTGTGSTQISAGRNTDQIVSAVKDMAASYNEATDLLRANSGRGRGTAAQAETFGRQIADEKTLNAVGISYDKNGKMQVNETALKKALNDDFEGTKAILGGQNGIADRVAQRADSATAVSSGRLVDQDMSSRMDRSQESTFSSFRYLASFAGSGPYSLGNYYTVGLMLNTLG